MAARPSRTDRFDTYQRRHSWLGFPIAVAYKVFDDRGWGQVMPDPDEPLLHLYAEGETEEASEEIAAELQTIVEEIEQGTEAAARS